MANIENEYDVLLDIYNGKRGISGVLCNLSHELQLLNHMLFTVKGSLDGKEQDDCDAEASVVRFAGNKSFQLHEQINVLSRAMSATEVQDGKAS